MSSLLSMEGVLAVMQADPRFRNATYKQGARVNLAADTTTYTLWTRTASSVTKIAWLFGLLAYNALAATADLHIALGTASFTENTPRLGPVIPGTHEMILFLPIEYTATIQIQSVNAGAANTNTYVIPYLFEVG